MALLALNSKPKYKYTFLVKYKNLGYLNSWLVSLNWRNPWFVSNLIMFLLSFLIYEKEYAESHNDKYISFIMDYLDENQDDKSGYWNLGKKSIYHSQMAGAYHFLIFYTYLDRKPKYVEKIIDNTLRIQDYDGLFNYSGGGGSCGALDAIDILCRSTFYTDYKKDEIKLALRKSYSVLKNNWNEDEGFCWAKRDFFSKRKLLYSINIKFATLSFGDFVANMKAKIINQVMVLFFKDKLVWKYSSLDAMKVKLSEIDIWPTWFRLLALATISKEVSNKTSN